MRALALCLALASALALAQSTGPGGASSSGGSATSLVNVDAGTVFSPGDITAVGTLRALGVAAANIVDAGTVVAAEMRTVNLDGGNGFYSGNVTVLGSLKTGASPAAVLTSAPWTASAALTVSLASGVAIQQFEPQVASTLRAVRCTVVVTGAGAADNMTVTFCDGLISGGNCGGTTLETLTISCTATAGTTVTDEAPANTAMAAGDTISILATDISYTTEPILNCVAEVTSP